MCVCVCVCVCVWLWSCRLYADDLLKQFGDKLYRKFNGPGRAEKKAKPSWKGIILYQIHNELLKSCMLYVLTSCMYSIYHVFMDACMYVSCLCIRMWSFVCVY